MKTLICIAFVFCLKIASAQNLTLSGSIPEFAGKKIEIIQLDHHIGDIKVDSKGKFAVNINLKPGYYLLNELNEAIYIEPGMALTIEKNGERLKFDGKGSVENVAMQLVKDIRGSYFQLHNNTLTNQINMVEPGDFFNSIELFKKVALATIKKTPASVYFKQSQNDDIKFEGQRLINDYLPRYGVDTNRQKTASQLQFNWIKNQRLGLNDTALTRRLKHAIVDMHIKKMHHADSIKCDVLAGLDLNDAFSYQNSQNYRELFSQRMLILSNELFAKDNSVRGKRFADKLIATYITNPFIKKEREFQYVKDRFRIKRDAEQAYKEYSESGADKNYIADIAKLYFGNKTMEGTQAPEFIYADIKGTKVSLSSLKGNYVFVDFWATYCLPCIGQIPAINNLEKRFEGKNIKFVSLSVDAEKDLQKWKNFVVDNKMSGIQLTTTGANSTFTDYFKVLGIPRFILLSPDGRIISEDALRPDEPELQKQLDILLAKN